MNIQKRTLAEINHEAIQLLYRHPGAADATRFLNQFTPGHGDYTEERKELFKDMSLDEIIADIEKMKQQQAGGV